MPICKTFLFFQKKGRSENFSKILTTSKRSGMTLKSFFKILKCLPERPGPYLNVNQKKLKVLSFSFSLIGFPMSNNL